MSEPGHRRTCRIASVVAHCVVGGKVRKGRTGSIVEEGCVETGN